MAAIAAAVSLAGCATPTVTVRQECQPINKYDTHCDQTADSPSPQPVTLTRPHIVVYELNGNGTAQVVRATTDASNATSNVGDELSQAEAPWQLQVAAPAGMRPILLYTPNSDVTCHILVDGQDVTGEFPKSNLASNGILEVCGATREP